MYKAKFLTGLPNSMFWTLVLIRSVEVTTQGFSGYSWETCLVALVVVQALALPYLDTNDMDAWKSLTFLSFIETLMIAFFSNMMSKYSHYKCFRPSRDVLRASI